MYHIQRKALDKAQIRRSNNSNNNKNKTVQIWNLCIYALKTTVGTFVRWIKLVSAVESDETDGVLQSGDWTLVFLQPEGRSVNTEK